MFHENTSVGRFWSFYEGHIRTHGHGATRSVSTQIAPADPGAWRFLPGRISKVMIRLRAGKSPFTAMNCTLIPSPAETFHLEFAASGAPAGDVNTTRPHERRRSCLYSTAIAFEAERNT